MLQKRLLAHELHRIALLIKLLMVILLVFFQECCGPLTDRLRTAKRRHYPKLHGIPASLPKTREQIRISVEIERAAEPPIEQREVARAYINLRDGFPIER